MLKLWQKQIFFFLVKNVIFKKIQIHLQVFLLLKNKRYNV
jgi:hypothetical protein